MKKMLVALSMLALLGGGLTACGESSDFTVGILQIETHPALDAAKDGFKEALLNAESLKGKKITFIEKNNEGVASDGATMAKSLAAKCDLLLGISTPSAMSLKNALDEAGKNTPLLFTAVTDPVSAELVSKMEKPGGNVSGTSDDNPVEAQIDLVKKCFPDKQASELKLGILYTSSEINSEVQANRAEAEAKAQGLLAANIERATCTDSSDIKTVATNLAAKVDAIYIPTDNNIAAHMDNIKSATDESHTLCIVGEENMLVNGGHLTYSVSYSLLGKRTGEMGAMVLSGEKAIGDINVEKMLDEAYLSKVYNSKNITDSAITIPQSLLADFTDISK